MQIKIYQLPFLLTLLAMPIPWLVPLYGIGAISWAPEILALLAFIFLMSTGKMYPAFKQTQVLIVLTFSAHLIGQILSGLGIGGSAILSVIVMTFLFYYLWKPIPSEWLEKHLIDQISIIYVIHIGFILFEIVLLRTGNINILMALSGGWYKPGFDLSYGDSPQSLSNQSQAASQLSLFAATWFAMLFLSRKKLKRGFDAVNTATFVAAVAAFVIYPTTTMQIVGIVFVGCVVYLIPSCRNVYLRLLVPLVIILFAASIYEAITYKFNEDIYRHALAYQDVFLDPIRAFLGLTLMQKLWGAGSIQAVDQVTGTVAADFGFGIIILQIGLVLGLIALISISLPVFQVWRNAYEKHAVDSRAFVWVWLGSANGLIAVGNFLSLAHYTVAIQAGARTLFAFHMAIVLLSLHQIACHRRLLLNRRVAI